MVLTAASEWVRRLLIVSRRQSRLLRSHLCRWRGLVGCLRLTIICGLRRRLVSPHELRALLSAFRYLFDLRADGWYAPLPLPPLPTVRERAAACAAAFERRRLPRLTELLDFVLATPRALCLPPRERAARTGRDE